MYNKVSIEPAVMQMLIDSECLKENTLIIIEAAKEQDFSEIENLGYSIIKEKIYKTNKHVFFCQHKET